MVEDNKQGPAPAVPTPTPATTPATTRLTGLVDQPRPARRWRWVLLALVVLLAVAIYRRDAQWGKGPDSSLSGLVRRLFGPTLVEHDIGEGVTACVLPDGMARVTYQNGTALAADGLGCVVVTKEDDTKSPDKLLAFKALIHDSDWPVVVFLNATGFDPTGEPIAIRRAQDGRLLYDARPPARVALNIPNRDGSFSILTTNQGAATVTEKEWVERYMRLSHASPADLKELDKLSDEELKKRGYERVPLEEAKKRGLINEKGEVQLGTFPRPRPPELGPQGKKDKKK